MDPATITLLLALSSTLLAAAAASNMGEGVVIGVLDDGIDAGHPSFGDEGMPPPPATWGGRCKHAGVAACNNKLVGAREFTRHLRHPAAAPAPGTGTHGTHASSIAAGAPVRLGEDGSAAVFSGVAPRAHLAFYQVCAAARGCSRGPIMNAVESALADGVDVLSMSLGDGSAAGFHEDPVVSATFSAVMRGVVVCAAAGNNGAAAGSVANDAPWILTVGASSPEHSVAAFSSHGPSRNNGGVLKPDIVGPGVDILAAVPRSRSRRGQSFAALSGTSMSAPYLSGVAALVKSAHPSWSPAAIKSAIMTTADASLTDGPGGAPASYLAMGAGLVDAARAVDPGLVYDISPEEYVPYLCGLGYTDDQVNRIIFPSPAVACAEMESTMARDLNTPSVMVALAPDTPAVTVRRTVTNVGAAGSVYRVDVGAPEGVSVTVTPGELRFDEVNQKASFSVTVERAPAGGALASEDLGAQVAWVSEEHVVRIPVSISAPRF
ncbi:unnamed protein product [Urochloa humidicola]